MTTEQLLIIEDDADLREALGSALELAGYKAVLVESGEEAIAAANEHPFVMIISDINLQGIDGYQVLKALHNKLPHIPILLMTAYGNIEGAVRALKGGAVDYISKPFEVDALIKKIDQFKLPVVANDDEPVAVDPKSQALFNLARRVAATDASVFVTGESGSGKEVLAQYIHTHSARKEKPFVAINCAAIPENMLEATLFGYEKGAFTGAHQSCPGKFEQAQEGTLLLDEVSEMALNLQAKLLRVLQEQEVERLGGKKTIKLNVRIIATSNCNMANEIEEGRFREDLFYRLNVFPLNWEPLRARPLDIIPLAEHLLGQHAQRNAVPKPSLSEPVQVLLGEHPWHGNVREMDNVIQRALILHEDAVIQANDIHFDQRSAS